MSLDAQGCERSTAGGGTNDEKGNGDEKRLKKTKQTDGESNQLVGKIAELIQDLNNLRIKVEQGHGRKHLVLEWLTKVTERLKAPDAELELMPQEKADLSSHLNPLCEEYAPLVAWHLKQQTASNDTEADCGSEDLKTAREELKAAKLELQTNKEEAKFLRTAVKDSNKRTTMLNDELAAMYAALASVQEDLARARQQGCVLSGQPRFEGDHDQEELANRTPSLSSFECQFHR